MRILIRRYASVSPVDPGDAAFVQAEAIRLAAMSAEELEWEGLRWRWGLVGECRSRVFLRFAKMVRRAGCRRLGELDEQVVWTAARRINWL